MRSPPERRGWNRRRSPPSKTVPSAPGREGRLVESPGGRGRVGDDSRHDLELAGPDIAGRNPLVREEDRAGAQHRHAADEQDHQPELVPDGHILETAEERYFTVLTIVATFSSL